MLRFIAKRLASRSVMFTISVLVFLIFSRRRREPRLAHRRAHRLAGGSAPSLQGVRSQSAAPYSLRLDDVPLFIKQDLTSYVNIGDRIIPQITAAAPITLSLIFGAVVIWLLVGISGGVIAAKNKGKFVDPLVMFFASRDLHSGVLAR